MAEHTARYQLNTATTMNLEHVDAIPPELRNLDQWLLWRYQQRTDQTKPTKVPYRAHDPWRKASTTDPASWSSFEIALAMITTADGIGFVFTPDDPYCGIDLDGFDTQQHMRIVRMFDSYTERSVNGGLHIILAGHLPGNGRHPAEFGVFDRARYFVVTGDRLHDISPTIGNRQPELDEFLEIYLPPAPAETRPPTQPIALDDHELLQRAFAARNGPDLQRLYNGDITGYSSRSEADLALCDKLAFWTDCDPTRIDTLFRTSGLMRDKWDRTDYRERTIQLAITGTTDTYTPPTTPPTPTPEPQHTPPPEEPTAAEIIQIVIEPLRDFLTRPLPPTESLAGVTRNGTNLLPRYGWIMPWGREGSGKTSVLVDLLYHIAAGQPWLHYHVNRPVRIVAVINEGIPGGLQDKLAQKLELWNGTRDQILDNIAIYASPWGAFSFRNQRIVDHARAYATDFQADYIALDPLHTLGTTGAGTPQETEEFKHRLRDFGLWNDLGIITAHHSNKTGMVSGDWARHADTVIHLEKDGKNPATKFTLEKARPADPTELGVPVLLEWVIDTMSYRRVTLETASPPLDETKALSEILARLSDTPTALDPLITGLDGTTTALRDLVKRAITEGMIVNLAPPKTRPEGRQTYKLVRPNVEQPTLLDVKQTEHP